MSEFKIHSADTLKIRCSSLHKIMTYPKKDELSKGAKSYIKALHKEKTMNISPEFWSRYISKGIDCEQISIELANEILDWNLPFEAIYGQQQYHENEYLTGHTDVFHNNILAEIKTSWNGNTFPMYEDDEYNKDYKWQCMGYLALTGLQKCDLVYCLIDTPEPMVLDQIRREHWKEDSVWNGDEDDQIVNAVRSRHELNHIPKKIKHQHYIIERDEEAIKNIYRRVELCREYWKELNNYIKNKQK